MKKEYLILVMCIFFISFLAPHTVFAHKLYVFAYEENGEIVCEATFSGGKAVQNSNVTITTPDKEIVARGTTDSKGIYRVPIPDLAKKEHTDLTITVSPGDGHQGSWLLEATEYLPSLKQEKREERSENQPPASAFSSSKEPLHVSTTQAQCSIDDIRSVVAEELAPIKRTLAKDQLHTVTLQDILGGLGYILGLAGIAAYMNSKKKGERR